MRKDNQISVIRACATVMVVMLHVVQRICIITDIKLQPLSDWLNLGLVMFFGISAYLYALRKEIKVPLKWFQKRYMSLIVPSIVTVIGACVIYSVLIEPIGAKRIWIAVMSGIGFEAFLTDGWIFVQLWFLTYILVCYMTVPLLCKLPIEKIISKKFGVGILGIIVVQIIFFIVEKIIPFPFLSAGVLLRFYIPYVIYRKYDIRSKECKKLMTIGAVVCIPSIIVISVIRYGIQLTGTMAVIGELAFIYIQTLVGIVLFYWLYLAFDQIKFNERILRILDRYSYPVYLTHCFFVGYSTSQLDKFENKFLGIVIALLYTVIASFVVEKLAGFIQDMLNKKGKKIEL